MPSKYFVCSFSLVSHWSKNKRGPASLFFKPEIWSAIRADNGKATIVIDPAFPPQNTETFRFPTCLAATARRSVKFFPYPVGRTAKTCWPAALQPSKHISAWVLGFKFREPRFLKQNAYTWKHVRFRACAVDAWSRFWPTQSYFARSRFLLYLPLPPPHFCVLELSKRDLGTRLPNKIWWIIMAFHYRRNNGTVICTFDDWWFRAYLNIKVIKEHNKQIRATHTALCSPLIKRFQLHNITMDNRSFVFSLVKKLNTN